MIRLDSTFKKFINFRGPAVRCCTPLRLKKYENHRSCSDWKSQSSSESLHSWFGIFHPWGGFLAPNSWRKATTIAPHVGMDLQAKLSYQIRHKRVTKLFETESLDSCSYPTLLLKIDQISQCVISGIKPEKDRDLVWRGIWDMFHPFWIRSHVFRIQHKRDFQGLWNQQKFLNKRIANGDFVKFILVFSIFRLIDFIFPLSFSIPNSSSSSWPFPRYSTFLIWILPWFPSKKYL